MTRQLDHLAIAVRSIEASLPLYRDVLGLELHGHEEVAEQRVKVAVLRAGDTRIELLEPTSADSPVAKFIEKRGEGLHHLAVRVDEVGAELNRLASQQIPLIDKQPRQGAEGARIAFLHPKGTGGVLIELVERPAET